MTVSASGFDLTPLTDAEKQQRAAGPCGVRPGSLG